MLQSSMTERKSHARIVSMPNESQCLDTVQMNRLEQSFRSWAGGAPRADVRLSRRRILLIFLLIRYTGGKLNEVLALNPFQDVDVKHHLVFLGRAEKKTGRPAREVQIPRHSLKKLSLHWMTLPSKNIWATSSTWTPAMFAANFTNGH